MDRIAGRRGVYPGSFNPLTVAHLEIAAAAREQCRLDAVVLAVSRVALAKETVVRPSLEDRVGVLERAAAARPWLDVLVTDDQLVADIAEPFDVVIMGADKWAQVCDPSFYDGSEERCRQTLARLPTVAVAPRPPFEIPAGVVTLEVDHEASSTAVRAGRTEWMAPEAAEFDAATGAWSDPERYERWLSSSRTTGAEPMDRSTHT